MVVVLTWIKTFRYYRIMRGNQIENSLMMLVLRDGGYDTAYLSLTRTLIRIDFNIPQERYTICEPELLLSRPPA